MWSEAELEFRRRRYRQLVDEWTAAGGPQVHAKKIADRAAVHDEVNGRLIDFLDGQSDAADLRTFLDSWSRHHRVFGFAGTAGAMVLNQLVKDSQAGEADRVLRQALRAPSDLDAATVQIDAVSDFIAELRTRGSGAAIRRAAYFTSWFWWIQDPAWEPRFPFAGAMLESMAWLKSKEVTEAQRYSEFLTLLRALDDDISRAGEVFWWIGTEDEDGNKPILGMDETLPERCQRVYRLPREPQGDDDVEWQENHDSVVIALAELSRVGTLGTHLLRERFGYDVKAHLPSPYWVINLRHLRGSSWVSWRHSDRTVPFPGIRLHVDGSGAQIILNAEVSFNPKGFLDAMRQELSSTPIPGAEFMVFAPEHQAAGALSSAETGDLWTDAGVVVDYQRLQTGQGLLDQLTESFEIVVPAARRVSEVVTSAGSQPDTASVPAESSDLHGLLSRFREEKHYPTPSDRANIAAGVEFRALLQHDRLSALTKQDFRQIYAQRYGGPGPQATLNRTVRDADESEWERILGTLDYLLWSEDDPVADRIDRVLGDPEMRIAGLGPAVVMKLLAISHDELNFLVYPFSGEHGKTAVLERLGLPLPAVTASQATRQLEAITTIRSALSGLELDPWEEMVFLYWLLEDYDQSIADVSLDDEGESEDELVQSLSEAAEDLYLEVEFLSGILDLLEAHRQVVFYGPPGTGKTFIAQRLAQIIAPDETQRRLVQFHPSTSYEDFVEGYRPIVQDGQLTYVLQPGPLRDLADIAQADPRRTYLLIIDEINRANLPRVLGELLFLLEYREQSVRPLYRPDEDFSLPQNLWIIGTMNTADRSVALLDAALRRRFQFVDFSPDVMGTGPISQVLANWVKRENQMEVLPNIVDSLNNRLRSELGGDHLAFGPSFFMRPGINQEQLRTIWRHQVQPLIDDLFLGDPERARRFALDEILAELGQVGVAADDAVDP